LIEATLLLLEVYFSRDIRGYILSRFRDRSLEFEFPLAIECRSEVL
jgi:hypothetical protein